MYCFHCAKTLRLIDGVLTCTAGQMPLSANLQRTTNSTLTAPHAPSRQIARFAILQNQRRAA
jgi:hypothetical protein